MFEILLTACMISEPDVCRSERLPGGETLAACDRALATTTFERRAGERFVSWPCVPAGATTVFGVSHVAPGVFVHKGAHAEASPENGGDLANIGFVVGERSVAVIDAGGSAIVARALLAEIRARTDLPVSHLILTHMHPDHTLGASVFREAGADVVGHPKLARALAARSETYMEAYRTLLGPAFAGTESPGPVAGAPDEIDLGGRTLTLTAHATAHTDNDLTVRDDLTDTLFLGDLLFAGHLPAIDGSINGWIDLMGNMVEEPAQRVVPGHGPVVMAWPEAAALPLNYLSELRAKIRALISDGVPMLEAVESPHGDLTRGWLLGETFHPRNVSTAYQELEWE